MRAGLAAVAAVLVSLVAASSAAAYGFLPNSDPPNLTQDGFTGAVFRNGPNDTTGAQSPNNYADLAGEHPETGVIRFGFQTDDQTTPDNGEPDGQTRDLRVEIPPGLVPDPTHFPRCRDDQIEVPANGGSAPNKSACPRGSQVGTQEITIKGNTTIVGRKTIKVLLPVYNMEPKPGQLARFAFAPNDAPLSSNLTGDKSRIDILGGVRDTTDYGLFFTITTPQDPAVVGAKLTFWNVPGDAKFDSDSNPTDPVTGQPTGTIPGRDKACTTVVHAINNIDLGPVCETGQGDGSAIPSTTQPFLTNPTACVGILNTRIFGTSYQGVSDASDFDTPRGAQDCAGVPFDPSASFAPKQPRRDSPTPFTVHLDVPQTDTGAVRGTSHVKRLATTLPRGVTINPSAGNAIQACADSLFPSGADVKSPVGCPAASKVGTVSINTPLLQNALQGTVYVGQPLPNDRYRLFIAAQTPEPTDPNVPGARTAVLRLKGTVQPDPATGQVTAVFDDLPQLPFSSADISFDGGDTGVLASTPDCSPANGLVGFGPWSGTATVNAAASITSSGCGGSDFAPSFAGNAGSTKSGAYSTVVARLGRADGQQTQQGVRVDLPPGLLANTQAKNAPRCADPAAASGGCPANTRVGTASVRTGAGGSPLALSGPVYFAGPYKGAPFSFVTVIRAVAGPYDLGNVVVRQAVRLDPIDTHVTVESDPLPQIVGGIPLRLRDLTFNVNKGKFVINPSSCSKVPLRSVSTSITGLRFGGAAGLAFSNCQSLKFTPRLKLSLSGKKSTLTDGGHPGVLAQLRGSGTHGQANFKRAVVSLPTSLALDPTNAETLCEYTEAIKTDPKCPKGSIVGRAKATSGILDKTLTSKVYFAKRVRTNKFGRQIATLPMLVVPLRGQGVRVNLLGTTAVSKNRLVTTFVTPDAPVSRFDLRVLGGKHGILVSNTSVCKKDRRARVAIRAQNGKLVHTNKPLDVKACAAAKKKSVKKRR